MDKYKILREKMVDEQLARRGIENEHILESFLNVPRELFVPEKEKRYAYQDHPLSIGWGQTISQPYIVALMTQLLGPQEGEKVLEIGTGSGYQAAILAYLGCKVFSVERIPQLAERAKEILKSLNLNVEIKVGDGTLGWEEHALYDKVIVTAAAKEIPPPLITQLKVGGRLIIPVGEFFHQELIVLDKISEDKTVKTSAGGCIFVPLIGKYAWQK
jgi:protein-L-isoaspartate(D-aspartate) O-methyltransferase